MQCVRKKHHCLQYHKTRRLFLNPCQRDNFIINVNVQVKLINVSSEFPRGIKCIRNENAADKVYNNAYAVHTIYPTSYYTYIYTVYIYVEVRNLSENKSYSVERASNIFFCFVYFYT